MRTLLSYLCGALVGACFGAIFMTIVAYLSQLGVTDMAQGGFLLGAIIGLSTVREARKAEKLWRQKMRKYE